MRLVDDERRPLDAREDRLVDVDELVGGEQHVELDPLVGLHARRLRSALHRALDVRELVLAETDTLGAKMQSKKVKQKTR